MKHLLTILLSVTVISSYAQVDLAEKFRELYEKEKYEDIIVYRPQKDEELTAKAYYYIAMSYYMKEMDEEALKNFDLAINKGPVDADMYFYKGMTLMYQGKYKEAIVLVDKAIQMLPDEPDFYGYKGEALYALDQKDSALHYFLKAIALPECKLRFYQLAAELYMDKKDYKKAIEVFESALSTLDKGSKDSQTFLYNLGLANQVAGNTEAAKDRFEQAILLDTSDYRCIAKLIQCYYSLNQVDKAKPYKQKLYAAHKKNALSGGMEKMFCFDQFIWEGKRVMAFENFVELEEHDGPMFVKHHFYVLDDDGEIICRIDSESSVAVRMNDPKHKYILGMWKGNTHASYWDYIFNDDYNYSELKSEVLKILNGAVKPSASSSYGNKDK